MDTATLNDIPGIPQAYTQAGSQMAVSTPLGPDDLLLVGLIGQEVISQPFTFELKLLATKDKTIPFDQLLGASITVELELPGSNYRRQKARYFNGICSSLTQVDQDTVFTEYTMQLVPALWLLSKKANSRIFQSMSIKEILEEVLSDLDLDTSRLERLDNKRDFCVQYQETDFNFVSRLMEEEGILYYFEHDKGKHTMVLVNNQIYTGMPADPMVLVTHSLPPAMEERSYVSTWSKTQEVRSGRYVLRDQSFQLTNGPGNFKSLECKQTTNPPSLQVDDEDHTLAPRILLPNGSSIDLEIYQSPGEFAQRFDGIDRNGGDRPSDLDKVQPDGGRTVKIRMAQETTPSLLIRGAGYCRQFEPGHWFTKVVLEDGEEVPKGDFVLTSTSHVALDNGYRSGSGMSEFTYYNNFTAIPFHLPYVPPRRTPKPVVQGPQTAVVVGMSEDDDIFTDKYGRVKVQFHWDRDGKRDPFSSCWIRVATPLAGQNWGMIHIPRVGQEVVVVFEDGDPDRPLILGCVYNDAMRPPYELPAKRTQSGYKSRSSPGGDASQFNEFRFEDKKGSEDIFIHAQKDFHREVENDDYLKVKGGQTIEITKGQKTKVTSGKSELEAKEAINLKVGDSSIKMDGQSIELKIGDTSIKLDPIGATIQGLLVKIDAQLVAEIKSQLMTQIASDLILQVKGMPIMIG
jgi:type VI secretion system secreted protein VgrG